MTNETITLKVEDLCRLFFRAYHSGHHDTVEGKYTDVLYVDADSYHEEAVREFLSEEGLL